MYAYKKNIEGAKHPWDLRHWPYPTIRTAAVRKSHCYVVFISYVLIQFNSALDFTLSPETVKCTGNQLYRLVYTH